MGRFYSCFGHGGPIRWRRRRRRIESAPHRVGSPPALPTLILLRHGQSQWNLEDRFTGWVDVDLTAEGEAQASKGGELIALAGISIDRCFTSVLTRAIRTSWLALAAAKQTFVPEVKDWRLNERHYGGLTGLNKTETAAKHGPEQVKVWRRSYNIPPPEMAADSEYDFS